MSLSIVATPIGNPKDITLNALEILKKAEFIIGEEAKVTRRILKQLDVPLKEVYCLNEHSTPDDIIELLDICKKHDVALISDCGTPGFCDPGWQLIKECRKNNLGINSAPGASSLLTLLAVSSQRIKQFVFSGFPPAKTDDREVFWKKLSKEQRPIFIMDTPYRLQKTVKELQNYFADRLILMGVNLTTEEELYIECKGKELAEKDLPEKAEFIALIYATQNTEEILKNNKNKRRFR